MTQRSVLTTQSKLTLARTGGDGTFQVYCLVLTGEVRVLNLHLQVKNPHFSRRFMKERF